LRHVVGGPGVDEQHVEHPAGQAFTQGCDLIRLADIESLDLHAALERVRKVVQQGSHAAADRADDVPSPLQKLGGHGVAETAGCANEQDRTSGGA
jgi:hypothetical protein